METTGKTKVVGFCRVSTDKQENSMEVQEKRIREYCSYNNLELVELLVDSNVSASKKELHKRPGGIKLREYIKRGEVKGVIAVKLDRMFRNTLDALTVTKEWDKQDIAFHVIDMGGMSVNTKTAMGKMMFTMMAAIAELESGQIGERVKAVATNRKKNLSAYATTPYGFQAVVDEAAGTQKNKSGKKIDLVPDNNMVVVKRMYEMCRLGLSKPQIAQKINMENIRLGVAKRWYPSTVTYVLKNDIYTPYL